jgi:photosystem II stability/assembly factor-like uncharacterized protein
VTRDGGRSWQQTVLPEPDLGGYRVRVAANGPDVYAGVLGPDGDDTIRAIYRSRDGGGHFTAARSAGTPMTLSGDLVPLRDGRLLLVDLSQRWCVSTDGGATFAKAADLLPARQLRRTGAGYVAYDLLGGGWAAFSVDGSNWHKIKAK